MTAFSSPFQDWLPPPNHANSTRSLGGEDEKALRANCIFPLSLNTSTSITPSCDCQTHLSPWRLESPHDFTGLLVPHFDRTPGAKRQGANQKHSPIPAFP